MNTENNNKISDRVAYIYYPYANGPGHAELKIDGKCWVLKIGREDWHPFRQKVDQTKNKKGLCFYCYTIPVTKQQLTELKKNLKIGTFSSLTCSLQVLTLLADYTDFKVPLPYRISPLLSHWYLSHNKHLYEHVQLYSNPETFGQIPTGMVIESSMIFFYFAWVMLCFHYHHFA